MITRLMQPIQNVVKGGSGRAHVQFDLGDTINRFFLVLSGTGVTKSMVARILGEINSKPFYDVTGEQQASINAYLGMGDASNIITVDFTEKEARTLGGHYTGAIGTAAGVNSVKFSFDLAGTPADFDMKGYVEVSEPQALGRICSRLTQQFTFAATGRNPILYPHAPGARHLIKRAYFFGGSISDLEVKKNSMPIFEQIPTAINEQTQKLYGRTPQAGAWIYDPVANRDMARVVNLENAQTLQLIPNVTATGAVKLVSEQLSFLGDL